MRMLKEEDIIWPLMAWTMGRSSLVGEAILWSKGKCQILRCLKIEEQLLSATILYLSKLIDRVINETRA